MQIPLDFYRILGVPTRSTPEQLQQAFEDRLKQLPRQEYSNAAIATRKQLLEEAFIALADPVKRQIYDQKWVAREKGTEPEANAGDVGMTLDVPDKQLAGALLLMQEMGAYPQILEIGKLYLERPIDLNQVPADAGVLDEDVILAMALAHLELGREQWQQSQFESAGESLQTGLQLLSQEQRFSDVQSEIRGDLFKLRPYRILELLNQADPEPRKKGLRLLQAMLDDRDGIDGNQDDQSGLSVNDFLRFVQQLREYLTVAEQQELFEREAARPSAVASYLAVYALIARGVSDGKPDLISRAKALLKHLGDRQDIAIETGMCWLLLGQPLAAHQSVIQSPDKESLDFMREYSEDSSDLIPGLYLYTENWLQQEVYPYFRDLVGQSVSLQPYFDNPTIQAILSKLELEPLIVSPPASRTMATDNVAVKAPEFVAKTRDSAGRTQVTDTRTPAGNPRPNVPASWTTMDTAPLSASASSESLSDLTDLGLPAWYTAEPDLDAVLAGTAPASESQTASSSSPPHRPSARKSTQQVPPHAQQKRSQIDHSARSAGPQPSGKVKRPREGRSPQRLKPWVPYAIAAGLGVGVVAGALALGGRLLKTASVKPIDVSPLPSPVIPSASLSPTANPTGLVKGSPTPTPSVSPSAVSLGTPSASVSLTPTPIAAATPAVKTGPLSQPDAKMLIESWQTAKAEAMSEKYDVSKLDQVLAEPVRSQWKDSVSQVKQIKGYWKYTLNSLEVQSVSPSGQDRATVKALVKETAQYYENGKLVSDQSYTDSYPVQYVAVRQNQQWLIKDMQVLR